MHRGNVSRKEEPAVGLTLDDLGNLHRAGENDHRHDSQPDRKLVADHLRAASHRADQRVLVVARPASQQDSDDADRRNRHQEEDADVEVEHLEPFAERQATESEHRGDDDDERRQIEQEAVDVIDRNQLLDQHLDHIGHALHRTVGPYPVRPQSALEKGADLALDVNQRQRDDRIEQQQAQPDQHALDERGSPRGQPGVQRIVHPARHRVEINTVGIGIQ